MKYAPLLCAFVLLSGCLGECYNPGEITKLEYSPDGKELALGTTGRVCIFDGGYPLLKKELCGAGNFDWLQGGDGIASIQQYYAGGRYAEGHSIKVWSREGVLLAQSNLSSNDAALWEQPTRISAGTNDVAVSYIFYPKTSDREAVVKVLRIANGTIKTEHEGSEFLPLMGELSVGYSPDGRYLTAGGTLFSLPGYKKETSVDSPVSPLAWSNDSRLLALYTDDRIAIYSVKEYDGTVRLTEIKEISSDLEKILGCRQGYRVEDIGFSPDGRHVAISGTYPITAGPSIAHVSGLGFVIVIYVESEEVVFVDTGGTLLQANLAHFDWAPDGTMVYLFDGEGILDLHRYKPE